MTKHKEFILTPITQLLEEAILATAGISDGINTFALSEYIFQSVLLKMAGFREQKMKCIAWDIATHDFEFRFRWLDKDHKNQGTYSTYGSKNYMYRELIKAIKAINKDFELESVLDRDKILQNSIKVISTIFENSSIVSWGQRYFDYFINSEWTNPIAIAPSDKDLFSKLGSAPSSKNNKIDQKYKEKLEKYDREKSKNLVLRYEDFYSARNQIAHNTKSYQQNLPNLDILLNENEESRNFFIWFGVLTIIDLIFIELYREYLKVIRKKSGIEF